MLPSMPDPLDVAKAILEESMLRPPTVTPMRFREFDGLDPEPTFVYGESGMTIRDLDERPSREEL